MAEGVSELPLLDGAVLPPGIRSRFVPDINGLRVHLLEAGFEQRGRPMVLLLHGFPEIAYSWRKIMPALAAAGFHVVAPDQRGYGRTTGWSADYDGDLRPFRILNAVRDALGLVSALGHATVAAVVGHDFGASVAAWCALVRPDVFRSLALMSAPFAGPPALPFDTADQPPKDAAPGEDIHTALARLDRPRKHYQWYYSTRPANDDMWRCPQGVHAFLRGYFHYKSADWTGNRPHPLQSWSAGRTGQDADLLHHGPRPEHGRDRGAGDAVGGGDRRLPLAARARACGLRRRVRAERVSGRAQLVSLPHLGAVRSRIAAVLRPQPSTCRRCSSPAAATGEPISAPALSSACKAAACTRMVGGHLIDGAGHWVQQEQPERVGKLLLEFLRRQD